YSYSFEPNPDWRFAYSGCDEIRAYIEHCVDKYALGRHLKFQQQVIAGEFHQQAGEWHLHTLDNRHYRARLVVSAVGGLVSPRWPTIPGQKGFTGKVMHTARWDRDYDLGGKRVAVIGTGASAIQVVPAIQSRVAHLTLFQRTAPWVLPQLNPAVSDRARRWFHRLPLLQKALRGGILAFSELVFGPMVILDSPLQKILERLARRNLKKIRDPQLRRTLTPHFHIGCKRVLFSNEYYPALQQPNVEVVTDGLAGFTKNGLRTDSGREVTVDAVILATGFRVDFCRPPFDIRGLDGVSLDELWAGPGGKAYRGVAISGIPNFFMMLGPNTGPGHTSVLIYTQAQARYITQAVAAVLKHNFNWISVRQSVMQRWHRRLQKRMRYTSWTSGCQSWYLDEHGENHSLFPGLASEYALGMRRFRLAEYRKNPKPH
ncbi:MAG: NAD(P)/FAD-dependent oxidoreductase, partial [Alcanivorax sp.]|nr:NAD(P)/FAD-dependent oxidoreductase [Alcanivorax sp.]